MQFYWISILFTTTYAWKLPFSSLVIMVIIKGELVICQSLDGVSPFCVALKTTSLQALMHQTLTRQNYSYQVLADPLSMGVCVDGTGGKCLCMQIFGRYTLGDTGRRPSHFIDEAEPRDFPGREITPCTSDSGDWANTAA